MISTSGLAKIRVGPETRLDPYITIQYTGRPYMTFLVNLILTLSSREHAKRKNRVGPETVRVRPLHYKSIYITFLVRNPDVIVT